MYRWIASGILCQRWGILLNRLRLHPESVCRIAAVSCVLHNYPRIKNDAQYMPPGFFDSIDGQSDGVPWRWRLQSEHMDCAESTNAHRSTALAVEQRNQLTDVFVGPGAVDLQSPIIDARSSLVWCRPWHLFHCNYYYLFIYLFILFNIYLIAPKFHDSSCHYWLF